VQVTLLTIYITNSNVMSTVDEQLREQHHPSYKGYRGYQMRRDKGRRDLLTKVTEDIK
jgi:ribosomal protein L21